MKFHTALIAAGTLAVAAAFASGAAVAQQKLVLKASDVHPAGYPTVAAVESMGKKLSDATSWPGAPPAYGAGLEPEGSAFRRSTVPPPAVPS